MAEKTTFKPQEGPQENFIASSADIAIYGGAAGGGKTWALLLEPLRNIDNPKFGAVFFRRSTVQIRNEGGLWDESMDVYGPANGNPREHLLDWTFPSGSTISFSHLEHDKTRFNWQGSQIPLICFDELTHFSEKQFWYMLSRNRSMCGVRPYIRATCNPDPDSWVAEFIGWWIDQKAGYAIPERSGKIRWFVRAGDALVWASDPDDLLIYTMPNEDGVEVPIPAKSVTFISSKLTDNKALMTADPGYMANLLSLSSVERERLLGGNWKVSVSGGIFKDEWWQYYDLLPDLTERTIYGDTAQKIQKRHDYTVFECWGKSRQGKAVLVDMVRGKWEAPELLVQGRAFWAKHKALTSGLNGALRAFKVEDKVSGTGLIQTLKREGIPIIGIPRSTDKVERALDSAPMIESGNVLLPRNAPWLSDFLAEAKSFPNGANDDMLDPMFDAIADVQYVRAQPSIRAL
jgi:predicted phage terminase large subunit-like protein